MSDRVALRAIYERAAERWADEARNAMQAIMFTSRDDDETDAISRMIARKAKVAFHFAGMALAEDEKKRG